MTNERRETQWIPNFSGRQSTAKKILDVLMEQPNCSQVNEEDLLEQLQHYKTDMGLEHIDLMQLAEWAIFEAGLVSSKPEEQTRRYIGESARKLMTEHGIKI